MASGHVYRTNRPNTWLHRPSLRREDSPCQPGAVHTWPTAAENDVRSNVGYRVLSGLVLLSLSSSRFDPQQTSHGELVGNSFSQSVSLGRYLGGFPQYCRPSSLSINEK